MKSNLLFCIIVIILYTHSFAQFEDFSAKYDLLTTIAGKDEMDDRGLSGWLEKYEE